MSTEIQQSLHGYQSGHQLLASSFDIPVHLRKNLLFQTDLSGPNIIKGFERYTTGYPVEESNLYILSKTWYADEMKRPGCVWTHSLFIPFSDLSSLMNLSVLLEYFRRPQINEYSSYTSPIQLREGTDISNEIDLMADPKNIKNKIVSSLYQNPDKTIIIPNSNSDTLENFIFSIWSDQWPRLRRNFSFCSGALSLKMFDVHEFDLQIVPLNSVSSIERQSANPLIFDSNINLNWNWNNIALKFTKSLIKNFLWKFGSELHGQRSEFIPLLTIFENLYNEAPNLISIAELLIKFFPNSNDAKNLKLQIFGAESTKQFKFSEREIIEFLLTYNKLDFIDINDLAIEERLISLANKEEITFSEFANLIDSSRPDRISSSVWNSITFDSTQLLNLLEKKTTLINKIYPILPNLALNKMTWETSDSLQNDIFNFLINTNITNWRPYIDSILESGSKIIYKIRKELGDDVIYCVLDFLNRDDNSDIPLGDFKKNILFDNAHIFQNWLSKNDSRLIKGYFDKLFSDFTYSDIQRLRFPMQIWIKIYHSLKEDNSEKTDIFACVLLSFGLQNKISGAEWLVSETFHDVFQYLSNSKIDNRIWESIPKELEAHDTGNSDFLTEMFDMFLNTPKKKSIKAPAPNDYTEILVRTFVNKHMKYKWKYQSFIDAFKDKEEFMKAFNYCQQFSKGRTFFLDILHEINQKKINLSDFQKIVLSKVSFSQK